MVEGKNSMCASFPQNKLVNIKIKTVTDILTRDIKKMKHSAIETAIVKALHPQNWLNLDQQVLREHHRH